MGCQKEGVAGRVRRTTNVISAIERFVTLVDVDLT